MDGPGPRRAAGPVDGELFAHERRRLRRIDLTSEDHDGLQQRLSALRRDFVAQPDHIVDPGRRKTCLRPGAIALPGDSLSTGRPS